MIDPADTICALSTVPGRSGLAVVRVSGKNSRSIYGKIFQSRSSNPVPLHREAALGLVVDPDEGSKIDEAIAVHYFSPNSYTGEDMTEYSIHGNPVLIAALMDSVCKAGARIAEPGEFTMRAFLNGKMDLMQAEAIGDIINAKTLYQAKVAARQRSGSVSKQINPIQSALTDIIVQLETAVEFVDEDISTESLTATKNRLSDILLMLNRWIDSFRMGRIIREGFNLAVIGRPNVGKSSIFNALLMRERSIVMDLPGTTRDLVSDDTSIDGIPVRLLDTAGIHDSEDAAENIGMDRSFQAIADADAVLFVVDSSVAPCNEDASFHRMLKGRKRIVVFNKTDLVSKWSQREIHDFSGDCPWIQVSAKTGERIEELRSMIFERILGFHSNEKDDVLITNLRHCHCLEEVEKEIDRALATLDQGLSEEFVLMHLHKGLRALGAITGETSLEDILDVIFSRFCIGK